MGPLLAITGGFVTGVFVRSLFFTSWYPLQFTLLLTALCGAFYIARPRRVYSLAAVFFIFCTLGMLRTALSDTLPPQVFQNDIRHRVSYEGTVIADPDVREKNQRIAVRVEKGSDTVGNLAVMPLSADVAVGDRVQVSGSLRAPEAFATDGGRTFRYDKYLAARGIHYLIEFGSIYTKEPAPWYSLPAALARIKHSFLDGLDRALPEHLSALAGGIVIGGKSGLPKPLQDAFTRSGLVQIIVLSGYNVMIVAEWVMALLAFLKLPRRLQYVAGGAALLLFVGIAGVSATAVRASVMALIALYARASGKTYAAGRALLATVFLMLVWNPLSLAFDPGFDFSVAATAGIIWLSPLIEVRLIRLWPFFRVTIATTLAAQIAVLPILLYSIGLLSLVAIPANLLVNPVVPLTMAAAALAGVVGMLAPWLPALVHAIGLPVSLLTRYIIYIAEKSAALPYAALTLNQFPFVFVLLAYAALIATSKRFSTTDQLRLAKKAST